MSDLISRKALARDIQNMIMCDSKTKERALELVQGQPTAYNVDKVVEQLEKISDGYKTQYHMGCYATEDDVKDAIRQATKIVKEGAVKDE
jgi:PP-loop superfamily ATP-utilizing enzyme